MAGEIMEQIKLCLDKKENFLLSGGAGSGKTYTLVQTLHHVFARNPSARVACITYTNVAVKEIEERSPYSKLRVATIHDFLWEEIKDYQKNLKDSLLELVLGDGFRENLRIRYSGEVSLTNESFNQIQYKNYKDISKGIISHDEVLKIANYMFGKYPLLAKILCDKYDYIFVDEYQDTQKSVIEIFLKHIKNHAKNNLGMGFFGDRMQAIYDTGVGDIQYFIDSGEVREIKKEDNYRCSINVINLLNKIRSDIKQSPAKEKEDGTIANKMGSALFLYSDNDFELEKFKKSQYSMGWDFEDYNNTKILFLTHKLSAAQLGFSELLSAYKYTDKIIGKEPDALAEHLLKIGEIIYHYKNKSYAVVIDRMERKIQTNADKQQIGKVLSRIVSSVPNSTIEEIINWFHEEGIIKKRDSFYRYLEKNGDTYEKVKDYSSSQIVSYYTYYYSYSPYSTQHGIKGAEFENVLVVMNNGNWNNYNFKKYFEQVTSNESVSQRTEKIVYVSCSRAKDNLIVYYPKPTSSVLERAKELFGEGNVKEMF